MSIVLDGTSGISTPMYNGVISANQVTPVNSFKNRLINGAFQINQRAASSIANSSTYSYIHDRWFAFSVGNTCAISTVNSPYGGLFVSSNGNNVTSFGIGQRIESVNCADLNGKTVTISTPVSILGSSTTVTWTLSYANTTDAFGTAASPTVTTIATGTFTGNGSTFSTTVTLPSQAVNGLQLLFTYTPTSTFNFSIYTVQIELGSSATSFDNRSYGTELALCQRYFQIYTTTAGQLSFNGFSQNSTTALSYQTVNPSMRTMPTGAIIGSTVGNWNFSVGGGSDMTATSMSILDQSQQTYCIVLQCSSSALGSGVGGRIRTNASGYGYSLSAEL